MGFIKEIEILYFFLILLKPLFDIKLIINYDLNMIDYHQVDYWIN